MKDCSPTVAPIVKGDSFNLNQCPTIDLKREQMKTISYASTVGSIMYALVCTRPTLHFFLECWEDMRVSRDGPLES